MEMRDEIPLDEIQGNITPGFYKDYQELIFIRFPDPGAGRGWVRSIYDDLTSALDVATYNRLYRQLKHPASLRALAGWTPPGRRSRSSDDLRALLRSTWVNVAFTAEGLAMLGADLTNFPQAFTEGLLHRTTTPTQQFIYGPKDEWEVRDSRRFGAPDADTARVTHAVLIVGADTEDDLKAALDDQLKRLDLLRCKRLTSYRGQTLGEGRMHFGFREGLSQPDPPDPLDGWAESANAAAPNQIVAPGEFILGCRNERNVAPREPEWARNGSYLVFLRLRQDVQKFDEEMERHAEALTNAGVQTNSRLLAAQVVGRWPSGAKLRPGVTEDPSPNARPEHEDIQINDEDFGADPLGDVCPIFGHVRRVHPRGEPTEADGTPLNTRLHRIIRRGIPYGPKVPDNPEDADAERGLLFLSYQASIEQQFEHIMKSWVTYDGFPPRDTVLGFDGLLGFNSSGHEQPDLLAHAAYHRPEGGSAYEDFVHLELARLVKATGGGYFFTPSIAAVAALADCEGPILGQKNRGPAMDSSNEAAVAGIASVSSAPAAPAPEPGPPGTYAQLAKLIQEQLPYGDKVRLPRLQGDDIWNLRDDGFENQMDPAVYPDNRVVRRQGLHATETAAAHQNFKPNNMLSKDEKGELIRLYLPEEGSDKPIEYELTKVIRIWYNYEPTGGRPDGSSKPIGTFLIIGYVGNGQP